MNSREPQWPYSYYGNTFTTQIAMVCCGRSSSLPSRVCAGVPQKPNLVLIALQLLALGVTKDSDYTTPNSKRMDAKARAAWISERNFVALLIAAHRGHVDIVRYLLKNGKSLVQTVWFNADPSPGTMR